MSSILTPGIVKKPLSLSSNTLKVVAIATMLIDHIGFLFFPGVLPWRIIGRMSFPLFAFFIAVGYEKTGSLRGYALRLLGFAVISHLPYVLFRYAADGTVDDLNIFFTLSAGLLAIFVWDRLPLASSIPAVLALCGLAYFFSFDYGGYGVLTVLASRLVLRRRKWGIASLLALPQIPVLVRYLLGVISIQTYAAMSVPLIAAYNGERGFPLPRWVLYWFYPAHLFLLWLIWLLL